jgi:hypothetical protein
VRQPYPLPFVESVVTGMSLASSGIVPEIEALALVPGQGFLFWPPRLAASFISNQACEVRYWPKRTFQRQLRMSAFGGKADLEGGSPLQL